MEKTTSYWDGVKRARAEGIISSDSTVVHDLGFSHQKGLGPFNSRRLDPIAAKILRAWDDGEGPPRILEIGPGTGVGASGMSLASPDSVIHTAGGLTPFNPYWRFSREIMGDEEARPALTHVLRKKLKGLLEPLDWMFLDMDELMRIQKDCGISIFNVLEEPYVAHQRVESFPDDSLTEGSYDFIYESCGPNYHAGGGKMYEATRKLLSPRGVLCMNSAIHEEPSEGSSPLILSAGHHTLRISRESSLARKIAEYKGSFAGASFGKNEMETLLTALISQKKRRAN